MQTELTTMQLEERKFNGYLIGWKYRGFELTHATAVQGGDVYTFWIEDWDLDCPYNGWGESLESCVEQIDLMIKEYGL